MCYVVSMNLFLCVEVCNLRWFNGESVHIYEKYSLIFSRSDLSFFAFFVLFNSDSVLLYLFFLSCGNV